MYCRVPKLFRRGAQPRVCVFVPVCSDCGCVRTRSTKLAIHRNYSQTLIAFLWPTIFFPSHPDAILCVCVSVCVCTGLEKKTHTQRIISHSDLHLYSHLVRIFSFLFFSLLFPLFFLSISIVLISFRFC